MGWSQAVSWVVAVRSRRRTVIVAATVALRRLDAARRVQREPVAERGELGVRHGWQGPIPASVVRAGGLYQGTQVRARGDAELGTE